MKRWSPFSLQIPARRYSVYGLRPLIWQTNLNDTKSLLRDHAVEVDECQGLQVYRSRTTVLINGQDVTMRVCKELNVATGKSDEGTPTPVGGEITVRKLPKPDEYLRCPEDGKTRI
jgi:hypothetical protein